MADITSNLLAHYKLNGDATDSSGNGKDGTVTEASVTLARINRGYQFDGSNDRIELPLNIGHNNIPAFSLGGWVNVLTRVDFEMVFSQNANDGGANRIELLLSGSGNGGNDDIQAVVGTAGNVLNGYTTGNVIPSNSEGWKHWFLVYNGTGSTDADKMKLYLNGVSQSLSFSGTAPTLSPNIGASANPYLGGRHALTQLYLNCRLDEFRIYGRALTPEDVAELYLWPVLKVSLNLQDDNGFTDVVDNSEMGFLFELGTSSTENMNSEGPGGAFPSSFLFPGDNGMHPPSAFSERLISPLGQTLSFFAKRIDKNGIDLVANVGETDKGTWFADGTDELVVFTDGLVGGPMDTGVDTTEWHHYAIVYDKLAETLHLYVDGIEKDSISSVTGILHHFYYYAGDFDNELFSEMSIAGIRLYDGLRTLQQIQADAAEGGLWPPESSVIPASVTSSVIIPVISGPIKEFNELDFYRSRLKRKGNS